MLRGGSPKPVSVFVGVFFAASLSDQKFFGRVMFFNTSERSGRVLSFGAFPQSEKLCPEVFSAASQTTPLGREERLGGVSQKKQQGAQSKIFLPPPPSLGSWRKALALRSLLYGTSKRLDPSTQNLYRAPFGVTPSCVHTGIDGVGGSHPTTYCLRIC